MKRFLFSCNITFLKTELKDVEVIHASCIDAPLANFSDDASCKYQSYTGYGLKRLLQSSHNAFNEFIDFLDLPLKRLNKRNGCSQDRINAVFYHLVQTVGISQSIQVIDI